MPRFVIQKHILIGPVRTGCRPGGQAKQRTAHFDMMIEKGGKLLTWSIPNILSLLKNDKITQAKKLPEHRSLYLHYEGKISRGRGKVKIWDKGTYQIKQCRDDFILISLKGKRLKGLYCLIADLELPHYWWILNPVRKSDPYGRWVATDNNGNHNR